MTATTLFYFLALTLFTPSLTNAGPHHNHDHDLEAKWSGGEHSFLGNTGMKKSCEDLNITPCPWQNIYRRDQKMKYDYGDIVALGDFYARPDKAFKDHRVATRKRIVACFNKEKGVHERQKSHPETDYPDCTWVYLLNEKNYIKLASTNIDHFAWHNIKRYVVIHDRALDMAKKGFAYRQMGMFEEARAELNRALFYNAFADHFLTDAFAAGHLRVPRVQLVKWAKKNIRAIHRKFVGDAFSNMFHNSEAKDDQGREVGLPVTNARGDRWRTQSDAFLFAGNNEKDPVIALPIEAVALSVSDILRTYNDGLDPIGVFPALRLVPFARGPSLTEKFKLPKSKQKKRRFIRRLKKSLTSVLRWITRSHHIEKMLKNLPKIVRQFSADVRRDVRNNPKLLYRIPQPYYDALAGMK